MERNSYPRPKFEPEIQKTEKPPLGLTPKAVWMEDRVLDIVDAMNRYVKANMEVPIEWIKEYNELVKQITIKI